MDYHHSYADIQDLQAELRASETYLHDPNKCRLILRRIVELMNTGQSLAIMFPEMIKLMAHPDPQVKKVCYTYMAEYAEQELDRAILGVNTLVKDCSDVNPMIRALALRTLCSLGEASLIEYAIKPLTKAMKDKSAYVRRTASLASTSIYSVNKDLIINNGFIDMLYSGIRDMDPIASMNCLLALDEILCDEGGVVINKNIAYHLLNHLTVFTDWGLVQVFSFLERYLPQGDNEVFDIMNIADDYLKHTNIAAAVNCLLYFLKIADKIPSLKTEIFKRSQETLFSALASSNQEMVYIMLNLLEFCLPFCKSIYTQNISHFFSRSNEIPEIKLKRMQLLLHLVNVETFVPILDDLCTLVSDVSLPESINKASISAIASIASTSDEFFKPCIEKLIHMLDSASSSSSTLSNIISVLATLPLWKVDQRTMILNHVCEKLYDLSDCESRCSFLSIVAANCGDIETAPYLLENFVDAFIEELTCSVKYALLVTSMKVFFTYPAASQQLLGRVFEICMADDSDSLIQEQASYYYKLLETDTRQAQDIICESRV